ncbi:hypothetical protein phiAS5_ORF0306 [Aeromonas phage phiAS5]|uniref:Uncharacterized protein n=1 Tax=Aeromonas phage phiAS5 TaxID=879630 RepID=E1A260_9CAUD|nr:hypothetical protein phiAS5_ORF0306 [Aeromonas phage phiAS5]ADM80149.1 hypothetical protein phiAS5_ORF0306 [Aeromonas phage phiAS5]
MKITKVDIELQSRFVDKGDSYGFGTTQSAAKCSTAQIERLLKLGLIKMCRDVKCVAQKDFRGFVRSGTHYCKA